MAGKEVVGEGGGEKNILFCVWLNDVNYVIIEMILYLFSVDAFFHF